MSNFGFGSHAFLFFLAILAGFALLKCPAISFLSSLTAIFNFIGALAIVIFALVIIYLAFKALIKKM